MDDAHGKRDNLQRVAFCPHVLTQPLASDKYPTTMSSIPTEIPGTQLHPDDARVVLRLNTSRFTKQHRPDWANIPNDDGTSKKVQWESDDEWLHNLTVRGVDENGRLIPGRWSVVMGRPTYPDNPELRSTDPLPERKPLRIPSGNPFEGVPDEQEAAPAPAVAEPKKEDAPFHW